MLSLKKIYYKANVILQNRYDTNYKDQNILCIIAPMLHKNEKDACIKVH